MTLTQTSSSEPIVVSYSEIDTYRQCRLKHQLSYLERWRTSDEAPALTRGTRFHSVMEAHYGVIKKAKEEKIELEPIDFRAAVGDFLYDEDGGQTEEMELVEWIYTGYLDCYALDPDWEIVAIEKPLLAPLPNRDGSESGFYLAGTIDLIVKDHSAGGGLWIVDHKTCKNMPKQKDFDMEDQTGLYTYLLKREGLNVRGAIYNHCRTWKLQRDMTMDERFKRTLTVRTDRELETMAFEALETMQEAYGNHDMRRLILPEDGSAYEVTYDAPRTPDGERCGWKCGYTEACLAGRKLGPERTRGFLAETGFEKHDTKPGPTFNKDKTPA